MRFVSRRRSYLQSCMGEGSGQPELILTADLACNLAQGCSLHPISFKFATWDRIAQPNGIKHEGQCHVFGRHGCSSHGRQLAVGAKPG